MNLSNNTSFTWVRSEETETLTLRLKGDWHIAQVGHLLERIRLSPFLEKASTFKGGVILDLYSCGEMDLSTAYILQRSLFQENDPPKILTSSSSLKNIFDQLSQYSYGDIPSRSFQTSSHLGKKFQGSWKNVMDSVAFLGEVSLVFLRCLRHPSKFRFISVVYHINATGTKAIGIISLISFLIGIVLSYQGSFQLTKFGAEIYTIDLLAISLFREIGILLTAIMVAGRSASAITAQIGSMLLNQEIDALKTFGLSPVEVLIIPRLIALVIVLPLLSFLSDIMGLLGGVIISYSALDITPDQFAQQLIASFKSNNFWIGLFKSPFFGLVIGLVGSFEGLQVKNSAISLGEKTTKAVVESIFLVIVLDAIFSIVFTSLGI